MDLDKQMDQGQSTNMGSQNLSQPRNISTQVTDGKTTSIEMTTYYQTYYNSDSNIYWTTRNDSMVNLAPPIYSNEPTNINTEYRQPEQQSSTHDSQTGSTNENLSQNVIRIPITLKNIDTGVISQFSDTQEEYGTQELNYQSNQGNNLETNEASASTSVEGNQNSPNEHTYCPCLATVEDELTFSCLVCYQKHSFDCLEAPNASVGEDLELLRLLTFQCNTCTEEQFIKGNIRNNSIPAINFQNLINQLNQITNEANKQSEKLEQQIKYANRLEQLASHQNQQIDKIVNVLEQISESILELKSKLEPEDSIDIATS